MIAVNNGMKNRKSSTSFWLRAVIVIFIAEQMLFMGYVILKKGAAFIDYIASLF